MSEMEHSAAYMKGLLAKAEAEVERLRAELAACDPKAVRVEAGVWETDAQRWKALAQKAEAENVELRQKLSDSQVLTATQNTLLKASRTIEEVGERTEAGLEAENAEHIKELSRAVTDRDFFAAQYAELKKENAELRMHGVKIGREVHAAYGGQAAELEALKARLEWFKEREEKVSELLELCFDGKAQATTIDAAEAVRDFQPKPLGGNVNFDEAKAWLTDLREKHCLPKNRFERECGEALDIALWLLEREPLVQKLASPSGTWDGDAQRLKQWEREHPCPGS
jgi:hypothetical protein